MSAEEHTALAHRFHMDIFQGGDLAAADELCATDFAWHVPGVPQGTAGVKQMATMYRTAFPDLRLTHEDTVAAGDKVVIRWTVVGTHQGDFQGIPPSGRRISITGIDIFRVAGGKLTELWSNVDQLGMLQQIGAIPAQVQTTPYQAPSQRT
jgi:steroid delta-isomerase-like uncharacterized protein